MPSLHLTFLGTGTSQGVPMIGCDCPVCSSTDPHDQRSRSSVYLQSDDATWVVDTGPDFRAQALRERFRRLDAVVFTHSHTDHIMGFDDLRAFCHGGKDLPIHASAETMADLQRVFEFAFNGKNRWPGYIRPSPKIITGPFQIGATTITPFPVEHGRSHVFGYLFSQNHQPLIAYFSDCKVIPDFAIEQIHGVRHLIVDALRHQPHPTHMCFTEALALAEKVQPQETWFTHLCHDISHAKVTPTLPPHVHLAYDGLKISA